MGKRYFKLRNKPNVNYAVVGALTLAIMLLVGNNIMDTLGTTIGNITCIPKNVTDTGCGGGAGVTTYDPFYQPLSFLGLNARGGTWTTTGILGIMGLIAVASFVLSFVKVSFKGNA